MRGEKGTQVDTKRGVMAMCNQTHGWIRRGRRGGEGEEGEKVMERRNIDEERT